MTRAIVPALVLLYAAQAFYFARYLVPVADGVQYLMVGAQAVRGELSVFDDRLPGNRMPLPFYVLGLTQQWGPDLLLARFLNIGFGILTLLLVIALAKKLGGNVAGWLAGVICASSGVVVAYWSYESYPAFAAFCFALALYLAMTVRNQWGYALLSSALGLIFMTRTNLWPALPALALLSGRERVTRSAATLSATFLVLLFAPQLDKILAYAPLISALSSHDATPVLALQGSNTLGENLYALARVIRRYDFLCLATVMFLPVWMFLSREAKTLAALTAWMILSTLVMCHYNWKHLGLYFASFAPAVFVFLGLAAAETARRLLIYRERIALCVFGAAIYAGCFASIIVVRNPLLPLTGDPFMDAHVSAAEMRAKIPATARIMLFGLPTLPYLAGLSSQMHPSIAYGPDALNALDDPRGRRMGFLSRSDYDRERMDADCWLTVHTVKEWFATCRPASASRRDGA